MVSLWLLTEYKYKIGYEKLKNIWRISLLAGKIQNFQTDSDNMEKLKKKKRRMRILSARIFSKSFGGKIRQN